MKKPVLSTYKILMQKSLNLPIGEDWVDWAIEMMEAGYSSENLHILAGYREPYNQFELQELANKVFKDFGLDYSDKDLTIKNYVYYLIEKTIGDSSSYLNTLRILTDICRELDYDKRYMDFYLLYYAKDELIEFDEQFYWNGANRKNIDQIIKSHFIDWKTKYEFEKEPKLNVD
jgi:hypothetical protein